MSPWPNQAPWCQVGWWVEDAYVKQAHWRGSKPDMGSAGFLSFAIPNSTGVPELANAHRAPSPLGGVEVVNLPGERARMAG